jgi:hypothetical protein
MNDLLTITGKLMIVIYDKNGLLKSKIEHDNLVVNSGLEYIASRMVGNTSDVMSHMEVGTGTTAAVGANTALEAPIASSRIVINPLSSSGPVITAVAQFNAGVGTGAISEAGIFNAASSGTMICRTVFPVVNKGVTDLMIITWTITVS